MVLVHCHPVDSRLFDGQLTAAAAGDLAARLVVIDLPGFGQSTLPSEMPDRYEIDDLADLVNAVIDHLRLADPVLGGVAIGGTVAVEAARRRQTRTAGIVLVSNKPGGDPPERAAVRESTAIEVLRDGTAAHAPRLARLALTPDADPQVIDRVEAMITAAEPRAVAALLRTITNRPDLLPMLAELHLPTLVVGGRDDQISPPERVEELAAALDQATLRLIPGAGHMAPIEAPQATTAILGEFLDDLIRARGRP